MRIPGISGRIATPAGRPDRPSGRYGPPPDRVPGQTFLNRWTTIRYLGEGSNAQVFLAQRVGNNGDLAVVKRIKDHIASGPRFQQFFDAEVKSMAQFSHPYAVRLLDASLDDPHGPCMVLEYIPGITLEALLDRHRRLTPERTARLLGPLCHALQAAHAAGIVHRDLKPANLMVINADTPLESVRVMDFGFAGFTAKPHIQLAELTGHGPVFACGTPAYVSPEMVRGDSVDARADLYSVGVILFEMLAGRLPFEYETQQEMVEAHVKKSPPRFHKIGCREVNAEAEAVVQIALSKYANERYQTAKDLADHFSKAVGFDLWAETAPAGSDSDEDVVECQVAGPEPAASFQSPEDKFVLSDRFEGLLPEKLAAVKLRGFIEDAGGHVEASEPGLVRVRFGLPQGWKEPIERPKTSSGLFGWLSGTRPVAVVPGREPIEVDLQMQKLDPNRVAVLVSFRPLKWYLPIELRGWQARCEDLYGVLRRYLMAD